MSDKTDNRLGPRDHNLNDLFEMVRGLVKDMNEMKMTQATSHQAFVDHMRTEEYQYAKTNKELARLADTVESLTALHSAFPEVEGAPDLVGHRTHHEILMQEAAARKKTIDRVKAKVIDMVVSGIVVGIVVVIALGTQSWLKTWLAQ